MGYNETLESTKVVNLLMKRISELENIAAQDEHWNNWYHNVLSLIERLYTVKSYNYNHFKGSIHLGNASSFLKAIVDEIQAMGLPNQVSTNHKSEINFNNNNTVSQAQNSSINIILDTIKDELPPIKLRKIQEIATSEEAKENKLQKVAEVLKDAGAEVISSTLAKIIGQTFGIY